METLGDTAHNLKQTIILSCIAASLAILLLPEGFVLGLLFQNIIDNIPSITLLSSGTYIESINAMYDKYINNSIGISITYPKSVGNYALCVSPTKNNQEYGEVYLSTPVKLITNTSMHRIFIASSQFAQLENSTDKITGLSVPIGCNVVNTTLDSIIHPTTGNTTSNSLLYNEFDYGVVANASDLNTFIKPFVPSGLIVDTKIPPTKDGKVFSYSFIYTHPLQTGDANPGGFNLLYDPTKHLALLWANPTEGQLWQGIASTGQLITLTPPVGNIIAN